MRRHRTKPEADEYGEDRLREWYRETNMVAGLDEQVIPPTSSLAQTVERILTDIGLLDAPRPVGPGLPG